MSKRKCYEAKREEYLAKNAVWAKANRPRRAKTEKAWADKNRDRVRAWNRVNRKRWYEKNKVKEKARIAQARAKNPMILVKQSIVRRARVKNAKGSFTHTQLKARIDFYGGLCAYCQSKPYDHIDHVIPISKGGTNYPANLRPACETCNLSKAAKTLKQWRNTP